MKKILVTGGSGFIGANLVAKLVSDGFKIVNLDLNRPVHPEQVSLWRQVNILDVEALRKEIKIFDPEVIIHLAAVTDLNGKTPDYYKANVQGTQNMLTVAHELPSLRKVLFTSSMYVCRPGYKPSNYDDYKPHTLYGESKVNGELVVKAITGAKFEWTIIRPTSIWGPWFGIPYIDFFNIVYQGKYFDFGRACTKTYGYIENTIDQIMKLVWADNVNGRTFYLGDMPAIQISEWADEISLAMGKGSIRKIPFLAMQMAALAGDLLGVAKIKFPMTSFRLSNMTTNNILPLDDLYEITGPSRISRQDGVKATIAWLAEHKGYQFKG